MDIESQLKNILEDIYSNSINEEELTKMIEETKSTNIYKYYLLVLTKYFPIQEFTIVFEEFKNNIMFISISVKYDINNPEINEDDYHCLYLMIEPAKIHIENLNKCGPYTGTDMMFRVINYAKETKIPKLELMDKSKKFICDGAINLAYLNILTTGQSWYNSKGFISNKTNAEKTNNLLVINKPFNKLVEVIINNLTNIDMPSIVKNLKRLGLIEKDIFELQALIKNSEKEELKAKFKKLINSTIKANNDTTIQEVFQDIQRQFRSFPEYGCTPEQEKLVRIINIIITMLNHNSTVVPPWAPEFIINYNYSKLEYTVPLSGGKKNKTKKNKKRY